MAKWKYPKDYEVIINEFYDTARTLPKEIIKNSSVDEVIHGGKALNKLIGVPHLRKESFDADIYSEQPRGSAVHGGEPSWPRGVAGGVGCHRSVPHRSSRG